MKLVRYCHECGHIGPVESKFVDCCPDGSHACEIPEEAAEQARAGFLRSLELSSIENTTRVLSSLVPLLAANIDPQYRITLILRHATLDGADMLWTQDDLSLAFDSARRAQAIHAAAQQVTTGTKAH